MTGCAPDNSLPVAQFDQLWMRASFTGASDMEDKMMEKLEGSCLCGAVRFSLSGTTSGIYQCRCSLCRKVSGSASNSALWAFGEFSWLSGEDSISRWASPTGFRSDFCRNCGSPLPNTLRDGSGYWVPAGVLDDIDNVSVVAQVCVASRAGWDDMTVSGEWLDDMPDRVTFRELITGEKQG